MTSNVYQLYFYNFLKIVNDACTHFMFPCPSFRDFCPQRAVNTRGQCAQIAPDVLVLVDHAESQRACQSPQQPIQKFQQPSLLFYRNKKVGSTERCVCFSIWRAGVRRRIVHLKMSTLCMLSKSLGCLLCL